MKRLLLILILISPSAFADTYAVTKEDGSVAIVHYFENSDDSLSDVLTSLGLDGLPVTRVTDLPADKSDRKFWKVSGKKVVVDQTKKQADLDARAARRASRDSVLTQLGIDRQKLRLLLDKEID